MDKEVDRIIRVGKIMYEKLRTVEVTPTDAEQLCFEACAALVKLEAENKRLKEKIKKVCIGLPCPDFEKEKKSAVEGEIAEDLNKPEIAFFWAWEMAVLECGEILSKP